MQGQTVDYKKGTVCVYKMLSPRSPIVLKTQPTPRSRWYSVTTLLAIPFSIVESGHLLPT